MQYCTASHDVASEHCSILIAGSRGGCEGWSCGRGRCSTARHDFQCQEEGIFHRCSHRRAAQRASRPPGVHHAGRLPAHLQIIQAWLLQRVATFKDCTEAVCSASNALSILARQHRSTKCVRLTSYALLAVLAWCQLAGCSGKHPQPRPGTGTALLQHSIPGFNLSFNVASAQLQ